MPGRVADKILKILLISDVFKPVEGSIQIFAKVTPFEVPTRAGTPTDRTGRDREASPK